MATVDFTFTFASNAQGLVDAGNSSSLAFAAESGDGNPSGCVKFTLGTKSTTQTEYGRDAASSRKWEDYGVPANSHVTQVEVLSYNEKTATVTKLSSHGWQFRFKNNGATESVHGATDLVAVSGHGITADGSWQTGAGIAAAQNVGDSYHLSSTYVRFEIQYDCTTGGSGSSASVDQRFDQIAIRITYTPATAQALTAATTALTAALSTSKLIGQTLAGATQSAGAAVAKLIKHILT